MKLLLTLAGLSFLACGTIPFPPPTIFPTDARRPPAGAKEVSLAVSGLPPNVPNMIGGFALGGFDRAFSNRLQLGVRAGWQVRGPTYGVQLAGPITEAKRWTLDWLGGLGGTYSWHQHAYCPDREGAICINEEYRGTLHYLTFAPYAGLRASRALSDRWTLGGVIRASHSRTWIVQQVGETANTHGTWLEAMFGATFAPVPQLRVGFGIAASKILGSWPALMPAVTTSATWTFDGPHSP